MEQSSKVDVVPWHSVDEFKEVFQQLFSPEISNKKQAVDTMSVWETRCHPSLPAAIDSSFAIMSALILDNLWANGYSVLKQVDIQFAYSSAIIRFVNCTVDVQGKQSGSGSLSDWAKKLGIPTYIVDIRNEATHSVLPSLANLRLVAEECMSYLNKTYWKIEVSNMIDCIIEPTPKDMGIQNLISSYANLKTKILRGDYISSIEIDEINLKLEAVLKDIRFKMRKNPKLFAEILATSDDFIPSKEDLEKICSEQEMFKYVQEWDESLALNSDTSGCLPQIPANHEWMWSDLIKLLHSFGAVPFFLECLLKSQVREPMCRKKLIISWVNTILKIHEMKCHETSLKWIFKEKGIVVDWYKLLFAAVQKPCRYIAFIMQEISCHLNLKFDPTLRAIYQLTALYLQQGCVDMKPRTSHSIFTLEQVLGTFDLKNAEQGKKEENADDNIFFYPSEDDYKDWPLGYRHNSIKEKENEECEEMDVQVSDTVVERVFPVDNEDDIVDCNVVINTSSSSTLQEEEVTEKTEYHFHWWD